MLDHNNNNNELTIEDQNTSSVVQNEADMKVKPHVIRRNIEDYLEQRALERRLKDIYDDDFLMD